MSFPGGVNWTALSHQNEHLSHQKTWCVLVMTALGHGGFSSQSPCLTILPSLWPPALPQRPLGQPSLCRQQNSAQWGWPHNDAWNLECSRWQKGPGDQQATWRYWLNGPVRVALQETWDRMKPGGKFLLSLFFSRTSCISSWLVKQCWAW